MQSLTESIRGNVSETIGKRGGRIWSSLRTSMRKLDYNEVSFAAALSSKSGKNVSPRAVDSWLRGQRSPTVDDLISISKLLNVSVDTLLSDYPKKIGYPKFSVDLTQIHT